MDHPSKQLAPRLIIRILISIIIKGGTSLDTETSLSLLTLETAPLTTQFRFHKTHQ
eukprot:SAG11_NODE_38622_length_251_cov_1.144737_1_plen_55_part_10